MWRSRETGSDLGILYSALALGLTSYKICRFGKCNCGSNCGVYRWVTLGPPPPHPQEGRPTSANRWGTLNWSIGNTSFFPLSLPMVGCGA